MSGSGDDPTLSPEELPPSLPAGHPERIGAYRVLRVLGEGGMGTVYEAVQDHPRRTVALKVVRGGLASPQLARRFDLEAELLGRLQHPGIAQVYEAGQATIGGVSRPYFAMELIRGTTLVEYAASKSLASRARLALMARICEAVQHAHERGVIHRDLKPSNILVDDTGQPKILDFGVARATDADVRMTTVETAVGQLIGTLSYMSPEQVEADPAKIDGRSDVYALGVVTYELLTGRLPHTLSERMLFDAMRVIREDSPTPISTVNRVFRGDVDAIVSKALEKDRDRRYASAAELGADLERHLREEPILARPPGTIYQLRKFARRNKALVGGVAAVIVVLALGVVASTWQAVRATREAAKARAVQEFVTTMLRSADPESARGETPTVRELIDSAAERVEAAKLAGQPAVEGAVRSTLAEAYSALGAYEEARRQAARALALLRGGDPEDQTRALLAMGDANYRLLDNAAAEKSYLEAVALATRSFGPDALATVETRLRLGFFYNANGREAEARPLIDGSVANFRKAGDREKLLGALLEQGSLAINQGVGPTAEEPLREALTLCREIFGPRHARTSTALWLLGTALTEKGAADEAEPMLQESLAIRREVYGPDHPYVALVLSSIGSLRKAQGRPDEADAAYREGMALRVKRFGPRHAAVAASLRELAWLQLERGDAAAAVVSFREAAEIFRETLGGASADHAGALNNLALAMQQTGDLQGAAAVWDEVLAAYKRAYGDPSPEVGQTLLNMAGLYFPMGRAADAERVTREGLAMVRQTAPQNGRLMSYGVSQLLFIVQERGAWDEAVPLAEEALALGKASRPEGDLQNAGDLVALGEAYTQVKRHDDARKVLEEAVAIREKGLPAGDWRIASSKSLLGAALGGLGRIDEAKALLTASAEALAASAEAPPAVKARAQARLAALGQ